MTGCGNQGTTAGVEASPAAWYQTPAETYVSHYLAALGFLRFFRRSGLNGDGRRGLDGLRRLCFRKVRYIPAHAVVSDGSEYHGREQQVRQLWIEISPWSGLIIAASPRTPLQLKWGPMAMTHGKPRGKGRQDTSCSVRGTRTTASRIPAAQARRLATAAHTSDISRYMSLFASATRETQRDALAVLFHLANDTRTTNRHYRIRLKIR